MGVEVVRTRSPRRTRRCSLLGLAILFVSFASPLWAQNVYMWANSGSDWGTASDWGGTVPSGTDTGLFNAGSYTFQPSLAAAHAVGGVWSTGSGSVAVTGSALTLNSDRINGNPSIGIEMDPGAGALTFSNSLVLGGGQTWLNNSGSMLTAGNVGNAGNTLTISGSGNVTINGRIAGAGGLAMLGGGVLQLSGSNTFSGVATVDGGTLQMTGGALTQQSTEYVGYNNTASFVQTAGVNSLSGTTGYLYLGNNGGVGTYSISGGSLQAFNVVVGDSNSGAFTQSGGTVNIFNLSSGAGMGALVVGIYANGTYNLSGGLLVGSGTIGDGSSASFTQSGGTWNFAQTPGSPNGHPPAINNFAEVGYESAGSYSLTAGLVTGYELNVGTYGVGTFSQSGGAVSTNYLFLGYYQGSSGSYNISGGSVQVVQEGLYVGNYGAGSFTQSGGTVSVVSNELGLGGAVGSAGTYNLEGGLLVLAGFGLQPGNGSAVFNFSGGTLEVGNRPGNGFITGWQTYVPITLAVAGSNGTINTNDCYLILSGQVSGPGGLVLNSSNGGYLRLAAANDYTGEMQVTRGSLQVGNAAALGDGALAVDGGTLDLMGYSATVYSLSGRAGTITNSSTSNLAVLTDFQSGTTTFGGAIRDGASPTALLLSGGTGTLVLTGTNTYTGGTTVLSGVLEVDNAYGLADGSSLSVGTDVVGLFGPLSPAASSQASGGLPAVAAVPEPGTLAVLVAAVAILAVYSACRPERDRRERH
jgi:fibronectin-binding autotransporter adhesin